MDVARYLNEAPIGGGGGGAALGGGFRKKVEELILPFSDKVRDLRGTTTQFLRYIGDLSSETKRINMIQSKLDKFIGTVEEKDKATRASRRERFEMDQGKSLLSYLFDGLFFVLVIVAAYLGYTLYRIKSANKGTLLRGV